MTKISLVTGGSRGLGRNTAISIARHGGDVISPIAAARPKRGPSSRDRSARPQGGRAAARCR